ncbi:Cation-transporting ATPase 4 [Gossypium australe]|uniref:Cation-transporting ATPase 4 n=1 Tax=Gossypium australe TaxID=47621 RepID=A0A5B6U9R9_9ROSI|nr:Cation-transporting ATPase 4 [Gossypium australe]
MEDHADSSMLSNALLVPVKRSIDDLEERHEISPKRTKMTDLNSVIYSEENNAQNSKSLKRRKSRHQLQLSGEEVEVSQVTEVPLNFNFDGSLIERTNGEKLLAVVHPVSLSLDHNTEICTAINESSDINLECKENFDKLCSQESRCVTSNGIGLGLNVEDVSSSINHELIHQKHVKSSKTRDVSDCGSSLGLVGEKDSLRVWKEMKQNGFLSSSHGGLSMQSGLVSTSHGGRSVPKHCGRKSKNDTLKKKMELAKKEQVDRFTKIAGPSGLLNGLNPGIVNHVRNRKQVHSLIDALVKSEKLENLHPGSKQASHVQSGTKDDDGNKDQGSMDGEPPNITSISNKARGYPVPMHKSVSSIIEKRSRNGDLSMLSPLGEDDKLKLKLSSSTKAFESAACSLSNEESANITSATSLSVKAATVASQWLELLQQDIKGRLSALQRSKKKVRAVVTTELPFLMSKEFSSNQGSDPNVKRNAADGFSHDATTEMHRARWSAMFDRMDKALSEEEKQLEVWLKQIIGMQLLCHQGLQHMHWNVLYNLPQQTVSGNNIRSGIGDSFDRELAVMAAAASIYSTCDFMLSKENVLQT